MLFGGNGGVGCADCVSWVGKYRWGYIMKSVNSAFTHPLAALITDLALDVYIW